MHTMYCINYSGRWADNRLAIKEQSLIDMVIKASPSRRLGVEALKKPGRRGTP